MPRKLRPTRAGWCFLAIVLGVGFAALNTGNNLLYLILALLLGFLVLSGLLSEASLRGLVVERRLPRELFASRPGRVLLRIRNEERRLPSYAVSVEDRLVGAERADGIAAGRCFVLRIGARETVERTYSFEPERRGELRFLGCRLSTRFPFGLFVKSVDLPLEATALVYPELHEVPDRPDRARRDGSDGGRREAPDGDELAGLREWSEGDSVKRVHWRRTLRQQRLVVGVREDDAAAEVDVLLSLPPGLAEEQIEARVSRAGSEVVHHLAAGRSVGLATSLRRIAPGHGPAHRTSLLSLLARIAPEDERADDSGAADARGAAA